MKYYYDSRMKLFWTYALERHMVYRRKEIELLPPPWTQDPIINQYKMTNTFRELDRGTKFVTNHILKNENLSPSDVLFNVIAYRLFNKIETFMHHGFLHVEDYDVEWFDKHIHELDLDSSVFTSAFIVSGYSMTELSGMDKISRLARVIGWLRDQIKYDNDLVPTILADTDMSKTYKQLLGLTGLGPFLAYQIAVDLSYWNMTKFGEDDFVIMGPGAKRGIDWLFTDDNDASYEELCFWLRDRQYELMASYNLDCYTILADRTVPYLTVMSLENDLCEFQKYMKAYTGIGRPRNRYDVEDGKKRMPKYKQKEPWMLETYNIYTKPQNLKHYYRLSKEFENR